MANPIYHIRGAIIVFPWLVWLGFIDVCLSVLLLAVPFFPDAVYELSSSLTASVWFWVQIIFTRNNGASITISGDIPPEGESAIVVSNHVSWSDFYMIQAIAIRAGMLGYCRYFAKAPLRWVPFMGWGLWVLGMPLVSRKWDKDEKEMARVFFGIVDKKRPTWLISFSEATRYTHEKYAQSVAWCSKNNRPQPMHLLYPRTKGFIATVQHLRKAPHVKAVYDVTIAYQRRFKFHASPTIWDTLSLPNLSSMKSGEGYKFHVHVQRFELADLPQTEEKLAKWLENRWIEKGKWLDAKKREWAN